MSDTSRLIASVKAKERAELAIGLFVSAAIEDYAVARWSILNGLTRQFYWSASQSVEKFCKLGTILRDSSVKHISHEYLQLLQDIDKISQNTNFSKPFTTLEEDAIQNQRSAQTPIQFVERLEKFGTPKTRYFQIDYLVHFGDLDRLDETIFLLVHACDEVALPEYKHVLPGYYEHSSTNSSFKAVIKQFNRSFFDEPSAPRIARSAQSPLSIAKKKGEFGKDAIDWLRSLARID